MQVWKSGNNLHIHNPDSCVWDKINLFLGSAGNVITGTSCLLRFALLHLADTEVFNKLKIFGIAGLSGDGWLAFLVIKYVFW